MCRAELGETSQTTNLLKFNYIVGTEPDEWFAEEALVLNLLVSMAILVLLRLMFEPIVIR